MKNMESTAEVYFKNCRLGEIENFPVIRITPGISCRRLECRKCNANREMSLRLALELRVIDSGFRRVLNAAGLTGPRLRRAVFRSPGELTILPFDRDAEKIVFPLARLCENPEMAQEELSSPQVRLRFEVYDSRVRNYLEHERQIW